MGDIFPEKFDQTARLKSKLRYGENPHQSAALYLDPGSARPGVARAEQLQGKELSFNNIQDADAAFECVAEFDEPAVVIVKHMNPCGVALGRRHLAEARRARPTGETLGSDMKDAYLKAFACDTISAFGGIVALNRELDAAAAEEMAKIFLEVVIAPSISAEAATVFAAKPNVRLLVTGAMPDKNEARILVRSVAGGILVQESDRAVFEGELQTVTKREPTAREIADMKFAFTVAKHVKSNAIVYAKDGQTLGVGAGQMSRIYSAKIAALKAQEANIPLSGAVMASDAFMPFPDCVEAAHEAGATAIIQPGGSLKDQDSIDVCDAHDIAMSFTGIRHFRH